MITPEQLAEWKRLAHETKFGPMDITTVIGFVAEGCDAIPALVAELARLNAEVERMRQAISAAEWHGEADGCPFCFAFCSAHSADCPAFNPDGSLK